MKQKLLNHETLMSAFSKKIEQGARKFASRHSEKTSIKLGFQKYIKRLWSSIVVGSLLLTTANATVHTLGTGGNYSSLTNDAVYHPVVAGDTLMLVSDVAVEDGTYINQKLMIMSSPGHRYTLYVANSASRIGILNDTITIKDVKITGDPTYNIEPYSPYISVSDNAVLKLENTSIEGFRSQVVLQVGGTIIGGRFCNNTTTQKHGHLIEIDRSSSVVANMIIDHNTADGNDGATVASGTSASRDVAIMRIRGGLLVNCTIADNIVLNWGTDGPFIVNLENVCTLKNSIVYGNENVLHNGKSRIHVSNSCVSDPSGIMDEGGNIYEDPQLKSDYKLNSTSPCIDNGLDNQILPVTTLDYWKNPRKSGTAVDMGASEYQQITDGCEPFAKSFDDTTYYKVCNGAEAQFSIPSMVDNRVYNTYVWKKKVGDSFNEITSATLNYTPSSNGKKDEYVLIMHNADWSCADTSTYILYSEPDVNEVSRLSDNTTAYRDEDCRVSIKLDEIRPIVQIGCSTDPVDTIFYYSLNGSEETLYHAGEVVDGEGTNTIRWWVSYTKEDIRTGAQTNEEKVLSTVSVTAIDTTRPQVDDQGLSYGNLVHPVSDSILGVVPFGVTKNSDVLAHLTDNCTPQNQIRIEVSEDGVNFTDAKAEESFSLNVFSLPTKRLYYHITDQSNNILALEVTHEVERKEEVDGEFYAIKRDTTIFEAEMPYTWHGVEFANNGETHVVGAAYLTVYVQKKIDPIMVFDTLGVCADHYDQWRDGLNHTIEDGKIMTIYDLQYKAVKPIHQADSLYHLRLTLYRGVQKPSQRLYKECEGKAIGFSKITSRGAYTQCTWSEKAPDSTTFKEIAGITDFTYQPVSTGLDGYRYLLTLSTEDGFCTDTIEYETYAEAGIEWLSSATVNEIYCDENCEARVSVRNLMPRFKKTCTGEPIIDTICVADRVDAKGKVIETIDLTPNDLLPLTDNERIKWTVGYTYLNRRTNVTETKSLTASAPSTYRVTDTISPKIDADGISKDNLIHPVVDSIHGNVSFAVTEGEVLPHFSDNCTASTDLVVKVSEDGETYHEVRPTETYAMNVYKQPTKTLYYQITDRSQNHLDVEVTHEIERGKDVNGKKYAVVKDTLVDAIDMPFTWHETLFKNKGESHEVGAALLTVNVEIDGEIDTLDKVICAGKPLIYEGVQFDADGDTLLFADKVVVMHIDSSNVVFDTLTVCSHVFTWRDEITYTVSMDEKKKVMDLTYVSPQTGSCDSIYHLHLTMYHEIQRPTLKDFYQQCEGEEMIDMPFVPNVASFTQYTWYEKARTDETYKEIAGAPLNFRPIVKGLNDYRYKIVMNTEDGACADSIEFITYPYSEIAWENDVEPTLSDVQYYATATECKKKIRPYDMMPRFKATCTGEVVAPTDTVCAIMRSGNPHKTAERIYIHPNDEIEIANGDSIYWQVGYVYFNVRKQSNDTVFIAVDCFQKFSVIDTITPKEDALGISYGNRVKPVHDSICGIVPYTITREEVVSHINDNCTSNDDLNVMISEDGEDYKPLVADEHFMLNVFTQPKDTLYYKILDEAGNICHTKVIYEVERNTRIGNVNYAIVRDTIVTSDQFPVIWHGAVFPNSTSKVVGAAHLTVRVEGEPEIVYYNVCAGQPLKYGDHLFDADGDRAEIDGKIIEIHYDNSNVVNDTIVYCGDVFEWRGITRKVTMTQTFMETNLTDTVRMDDDVCDSIYNLHLTMHFPVLKPMFVVSRWPYPDTMLYNTPLVTCAHQQIFEFPQYTKYPQQYSFNTGYIGDYKDVKWYYKERTDSAYAILNDGVFPTKYYPYASGLEETRYKIVMKSEDGYCTDSMEYVIYPAHNLSPVTRDTLMEESPGGKLRKHSFPVFSEKLFYANDSSCKAKIKIYDYLPKMKRNCALDDYRDTVFGISTNGVRGRKDADGNIIPTNFSFKSKDDSMWVEENDSLYWEMGLHFVIDGYEYPEDVRAFREDTFLISPYNASLQYVHIIDTVRPRTDQYGISYGKRIFSVPSHKNDTIVGDVPFNILEDDVRYHLFDNCSDVAELSIMMSADSVNFTPIQPSQSYTLNIYTEPDKKIYYRVTDKSGNEFNTTVVYSIERNETLGSNRYAALRDTIVTDAQIPFEWYGQTITQTGVTEIGAARLSVNVEFIQNITICAGEPLQYADMTFQSEKDSIRRDDKVFVLYIDSTRVMLDTLSVCSDSYTWIDGQTYHTTETEPIKVFDLRHVIAQDDACDSIFHLHLILHTGYQRPALAERYNFCKDEKVVLPFVTELGSYTQYQLYEKQADASVYTTVTDVDNLIGTGLDGYTYMAELKTSDNLCVDSILYKIYPERGIAWDDASQTYPTLYADNQCMTKAKVVDLMPNYEATCSENTFVKSVCRIFETETPPDVMEKDSMKLVDVNDSILIDSRSYLIWEVGYTYNNMESNKVDTIWTADYRVKQYDVLDTIVPKLDPIYVSDETKKQEVVDSITGIVPFLVDRQSILDKVTDNCTSSEDLIVKVKKGDEWVTVDDVEQFDLNVFEQPVLNIDYQVIDQSNNIMNDTVGYEVERDEVVKKNHYAIVRDTLVVQDDMPYTWHGTVFTDFGETHEVGAALLTVNEKILYDTIDYVLCAGQPMEYKNVPFKYDGDSIIVDREVVVLTIDSSKVLFDTLYVCASSYTGRENDVYGPGTYEVVYNVANGNDQCDSIINLHLVVYDKPMKFEGDDVTVVRCMKESIFLGYKDIETRKYKKATWYDEDGQEMLGKDSTFAYVDGNGKTGETFKLVLSTLDEACSDTTVYHVYYSHNVSILSVPDITDVSTYESCKTSVTLSDVAPTFEDDCSEDNLEKVYFYRINSADEASFIEGKPDDIIEVSNGDVLDWKVGLRDSDGTLYTDVANSVVTYMEDKVSPVIDADGISYGKRKIPVTDSITGKINFNILRADITDHVEDNCTADEDLKITYSIDGKKAKNFDSLLTQSLDVFKKTSIEIEYTIKDEQGNEVSSTVVYEVERGENVDGNDYAIVRDTAVCKLPFVWHSQIFSKYGDKTETGAALLSVSEDRSFYKTDTIDACLSYVWRDGKTYTRNTKTPIYKLRNPSGCDSTITLFLTIHKPVENEVWEVSYTKEYNWNGQIYTEEDDYEQTLVDRYGCDSVVTMHLSFDLERDTVFRSMPITYCESDGFATWRDIKITQDTSVFIMTGPIKVDTLYTITLTPIESRKESIRVFDFAPVTINGETYAKSGTYKQNFTSSIGCDSTLVIEATIEPNPDEWNMGDDLDHYDHYSIAQKLNYCSSVGYAEWNGLQLKKDTTVVRKVGEVDTTYTIKVYELPSNKGTLEIEDSSAVVVNDVKYTESGDYVQNLVGTNGCDSTLFIHFTYIEPTTPDTTPQRDHYFLTKKLKYCSLDGYVEWHGLKLTNDTTVNFVGVESDTTYNLEVTRLESAVENIKIEDYEPVTVNNETYSETGVYEQKFVSSNGCDSTLVIHFSLKDSVGGTTTDPDTLTTPDDPSVQISHYYLTKRLQYCASDKFVEWHGLQISNDTTIKVSTDKTDTTYSLVVIRVDSKKETIKVESYEPITINGETFDESGIYQQNFVATSGCDSTLVIHLAMKDSTGGVGSDDPDTPVIPDDPTVKIDHYYLTQRLQYCASDNYVEWHGLQLSNDTLLKFVGTNTDTAYSVVVNRIEPKVETLGIVDYESVTVNDETYTESGVYEQHLKASNGCDSTLIIRLTIREVDGGTDEPTDPVLPDNPQDPVDHYLLTERLNYCASANYVEWRNLQLTNDTVIKIDGAKSDTTFKIIVNRIEPKKGHITATSCDSLVFNNIVYKTSGEYEQYFIIDGCDSTLYLHLTISKSDVVEKRVVYDDAIGYATWQGINVTKDTVLKYQNQNGCDSIVKLSVVPQSLYNPVIVYETIAEIACGSYVFDGQTITESGRYDAEELLPDDTIKHITLDLTVNPIAKSEATVTYCESLGFAQWEDVNITKDTVFTYQAANGCDSLVTVRMKPLKDKSSKCRVETNKAFTWNGVVYSKSGTYIKRFEVLSDNGCDSVAILQLVIDPGLPDVIKIENSFAACSVLEWNGNIFDETGTYERTISAPMGDTIYTLNVTIFHTVEVEDTIYVETCDNASDPAMWRDFQLEKGNNVLTVKGDLGCDSIFNVWLTVNPTYHPVIDEVACGLYEWDGDVFTESGTYEKTFTTVSGCDSLVTINLTVHPVYTDTIYDTIQVSEKYEKNGFIVEGEEVGDLVERLVLPTVDGCDSTIVLKLRVNPYIRQAEIVEVLGGINVTINQITGHVYCGKDTVQLSYSIPEENIGRYRIMFEDDAIDNGFVETEGTTNSEEGDLLIPVEDSANSGYYTAFVQFFGEEYNSVIIPVTFSVGIDSSDIKVVSADELTLEHNHQSFINYQWYKDMEVIEGADNRAYVDPERLYGTYVLALQTENELVTAVCPNHIEKKSDFKFWASSSQSGRHHITNLFIEGLTSKEMEKAELYVYSTVGVMMKHLRNVSIINPVRLENGVYIGILKRGNDKEVIKFMAF